MDCAHRNLEKVAKAVYSVTAKKVEEAMSWPGEYQHTATPFDELADFDRELHLEYAVAAIQAIQDVFGL